MDGKRKKEEDRNMADAQGTQKYEFGAAENRVLADLSRSLHRLGAIVLITGILFVAYLVVSFLDPAPLVAVSDAKTVTLTAVDYSLWIVVALLIIYLSIMTIHLAKPVRQIVETSGADITHLMDFLDHVTSMSRLSFKALVVIAVLLIVSLILLVLVF